MELVINNLDSKTAVVTGGAQGIGRGIVLELARAGANVVVADLDKEKAKMVVAEVKALGRDAIALQFNVTDSASIKNGVEQALNHFPRIDILINNAGVHQQGLGNTSLEDFERCYNVNLKGVWKVTSELVPHFKANKSGKIVNIASTAGRQGAGGMPAYCASKAGVINLTQSLACALGSGNINVNAICPGMVKTAMTTKGWDEMTDPNYFSDFVERTTQLKRIITPEDIGSAVVFLTSPQAINITGQTLNIDGGHIMN